MKEQIDTYTKWYRMMTIYSIYLHCEGCCGISYGKPLSIHSAYGYTKCWMVVSEWKWNLMENIGNHLDLYVFRKCKWDYSSFELDFFASLVSSGMYEASLPTLLILHWLYMAPICSKRLPLSIFTNLNRLCEIIESIINILTI